MKLQEAEKLAKELIKEYCPEYIFKWGRGKNRFGTCYYNQKWISLSKILTELNDEARVKNTILHEIAHALTPTCGHNWKWVKQAKAIGCDGKRLYSKNEVITPKDKFTGKCPNCGRIVTRNKRNKIACGECCRNFNYGRFDQKYLINWN